MKIKALEDFKIKCRFNFYKIKNTKVLIAMTIILTLIYLLVTYALLSWRFFTDFLCKFYDIHDLDSFIISQKASALDNSLLIIFVTLALSIVKASDPSMETLDKRIAFLFPNLNNNSAEGLRFIKRHIQRLATFSPRTHVTYQLDKYDSEYNLMKVEMVYECSISNLHNRDPLSGEDIAFTFDLTTDASNAIKKRNTANSKCSKNIYWGKVSEIRTIAPKTSDKWLWHTKGHHMLLEGEGHSANTFRLDKLHIPPNEEAQLDCRWSYWTFNDKKAFDTFGGFRFTKRLEIHYVNNFDQVAEVEMMIITKHDYDQHSVSEWQNKNWREYFDNSNKTRCQYFSDKLTPLSDTQESAPIGSGSSNRAEFKYSDFSADHILIWRVKWLS